MDGLSIRKEKNTPSLKQADREHPMLIRYIHLS